MIYAHSNKVIYSLLINKFHFILITFYYFNTFYYNDVLNYTYFLLFSNIIPIHNSILIIQWYSNQYKVEEHY